MFNVWIGDNLAHVEFEHANIFLVGPTDVQGTRQGTICRISNLHNSDDPMYLGSSICNPSDEYNGNVGQKLALTRAIEDAPRAVRAIIWAGYFKSRGYIN